MKNEYILTPYRGELSVGDQEYYRGFKPALIEIDRMLIQINCEEIDVQVIYNADHEDSELSDIWYKVTRDTIKKYDGGQLLTTKKRSQVNDPISTLDLIIEDIEKDVKAMEGAPFTGRVVAENFGMLRAQVQVMAKIMKQELEKKQ